ncbi:hypothetical protein DH2020_006651 [Rehmannia glutinosa]|uniref:Uncharacterized protein n=1 Tax=Rehmannia glutinosa TaxID=99300 RepID=A0ABR0XJK1_REHGL
MEGNCRPETTSPPLLPSAANIGCSHELTPSSWDASSLTAENCKDILRRSENVAQLGHAEILGVRVFSVVLSVGGGMDDRTAWTDEKHNSYLHHLEASFVKQLHQSKCLLAQCSDQNQRDINIFQKRLSNVKNASEQFNVLRNGRWQKINCSRGEPLCGSTSTDSCASLKSKWIYNFKRINKQCHPPSAEIPDFPELCISVKHGKRTISHGLATCSRECSSNDPYLGNLFDLQREGTGQNFLDEDNQNTSKFESQAKRLKTTLAESSLQDQIVRSTKCSTADYSVISSSTPGEE